MAAMLKCHTCRARTHGQELSPGCTSAICDRCYAARLAGRPSGPNGEAKPKPKRRKVKP